MLTLRIPTRAPEHPRKGDWLHRAERRTAASTMISSPHENASRCVLTCRRGHNADSWEREPRRGPNGSLWPSIPRFLLKSPSDLPWR